MPAQGVQAQRAGSVSLRLGLISDTHRRTKRAKRIIELFVAANVDMIIHAGDIVDDEVLKEIADTQIPYLAVFGNNDRHLCDLQNMYQLVYEPHLFTLPDNLATVKLMHIPLYLAPQQELIIFGHTHKKYVNFTGKTLFINPGEACARNKDISECMILDVTQELFRVEYLYRKIKSDVWNRSISEFNRPKGDV